MYVVWVEFTVHAERTGAFLTRVQQQARDSLEKEPDCHHFDVCVDRDDPRIVVLYELYSDEAAFKVHLASDHFQAFDAEVSDWLVEKVVKTFDRQNA